MKQQIFHMRMQHLFIVRNNVSAASGNEPEAAIFLIFFIKFGLVAVASDQDIRHPGGRLPHDGSDAADIGILRAFDDKLVMDMAADLLIGKILHSVAQ